jgi:hypothetical protein
MSDQPTYAEAQKRLKRVLEDAVARCQPHLEPDEQEELLDEPGPQIENFFGADRYV